MYNYYELCLLASEYCNTDKSSRFPINKYCEEGFMSGFMFSRCFLIAFGWLVGYFSLYQKIDWKLICF